MRPRDLRTMAAFALTMTALASCSATAGPATQAYRGTLRSSCAPHDAPSTELRLEPIESPGWVWFNLWPEGGVTTPGAVRFDGDRPIGQGAICLGAEDCEPAEPAEWGEVIFLGRSEDGKIHGEWTLGLPGGTVHRGVFEAEWLAIQAMCG